LSAIELNPDDTRTHERLGDVTYALGRHKEAIAHYSNYLEFDDQSPQVLYKLALASERDGRVAYSLPLLRRAISLNSDFREAHYLLGLCLTEQGRTGEARDAMLTALELSPGFLKAREALVTIYSDLGFPDEALSQLDALLLLDQANPERHLAKGLAYLHLGDFDNALDTLNRGIDAHPNNQRLIVALGETWLSLAESGVNHRGLVQALQFLRSIPRSDASSAALTALGRALSLSGDTEGATRAFRIATQRFPLDPTAFLYLAEQAEDENDNELANRHRKTYETLAERNISPQHQTALPSG